MSRRGVSELVPIRFGESLYGTASTPTAGAGSAEGRPLNTAWEDIDSEPRVRIRTRRGVNGKVSVRRYPTAVPGAGRKITLKFTRYERAFLDQLIELVESGQQFDLVITMADGRVWSGKAKAWAPDATAPVSASGDHSWYGATGRELVVALISTEGGFL